MHDSPLLAPERRLARALGVGLGAYGVCHACLGMIALELDHGDDASIADVSRSVVVSLWCDGLGGPVEDALHAACRKEIPGAGDALRDFEARGPRSTIFRAVVRELAETLRQEVSRSYRASLN